MKGINLYHEVPCGTPDAFNMVVDIPKGSYNKVQYDEEGGYFTLDRVVHSPYAACFDYGFIPQTHSGDGDALDVCLLVTHPTFSGCVVQARAIGMLKTADEAGGDNKIIAVPVSKRDHRFDEVQTIEDLPKRLQEEILIHFREIKKLEPAKYEKVVIDGFATVDEAKIEIQKTMDAYKAKPV